MRNSREGPTRLRLSIAGLMVLVLFLGIWLAAMRSGSGLWLQVSWTLTASVLVTATIAARYRGAFWYGFAIAGWGYFLLGSVAWIGLENSQFPGAGTLNRMLVSADLVVYLCSYVPGFRTEGFSSALEMERCRNIEVICHSMLTLLFAPAGGMIARLIASQNRDD
jgi:hypothetical protein